MKRTMQSLQLLALAVFFTATAAAQSQVNKPALFANYPEKISCNTAILSQAFAVNEHQTAAFGFSDNFLFRGQVASNTTKYNGVLQTIVIKSADFDGALFVLSKTINANKQPQYKGHIINGNYADGFELMMDAAGNYQLIKFDMQKQLQDCKQ